MSHSNDEAKTGLASTQTTPSRSYWHRSVGQSYFETSIYSEFASLWISQIRISASHATLKLCSNECTPAPHRSGRRWVGTKEQRWDGTVSHIEYFQWWFPSGYAAKESVSSRTLWEWTWTSCFEPLDSACYPQSAIICYTVYSKRPWCGCQFCSSIPSFLQWKNGPRSRWMLPRLCSRLVRLLFVLLFVPILTLLFLRSLWHFRKCAACACEISLQPRSSC